MVSISIPEGIVSPKRLSEEWILVLNIPILGPLQYPSAFRERFSLRACTTKAQYLVDTVRSQNVPYSNLDSPVNLGEFR